jgi:hypothetical protein
MSTENAVAVCKVRVGGRFGRFGISAFRGFQIQHLAIGHGEFLQRASNTMSKTRLTNSITKI